MPFLRSVLSQLPYFRNIVEMARGVKVRDDFVVRELGKLENAAKILDAGCGSQPYRKYCNHLLYFSQDFGKYKFDDKKMLGTNYDREDFEYGNLDYVGDIWKIDEKNETFDAILCTEVFEHIPFPNETLAEFSRLLKRGGKLILTVPSNSLRHMDPYYFYSGLSDRWFEYFLPKNSFELVTINTIGDYYSWMAVEIARTAVANSIFSKILLLPTFLYYYNKKETELSKNTLCFAYHVVAIKV